MAVEDLTTDLRAHLTDTVGLDLRHDALSEREVLFASILGLMRAQTLSSTVLCPVIHRFPEQLCGSWSATPEGQRAKVFLDAGGDAMDENKMWQLMLYTWLGAGGVSGLPWKHILATDGLTHYEPSSDQAMAVVKFAMLYTQCRGNHVLKFFGSDGRDKGLRFSQDKFLMLKAWHASVPALTAALNFNTASFVSKMRDIDGFGELAVKEVLSYLGVSGHERFRTMAFQFIPFGPGAKNGASLFFGCTRKLLQLATNLQPHIQEYLAKCFPTVEPGVTVVDIEIFLCYGYTYCKMVQQLRSGSGTYKVPAGWSPRDHKSITPRFDGELTTREAVPHRHLQTPWHLASFWGFQSLAKHFGQISAKRAKKRPAKDRPRKKGRTAMNGTGAASSAAAPRNSDPRLRRDDKDVNTYYQAWDQVNVDRALVAEDGMDPNVVPENIRPLADFGDLDRQLDMSTKISRFSWDQSDRFVSIYVPFDGRGRQCPHKSRTGVSEATAPLAKMPGIDYSKFDKIEDSDDEPPKHCRPLTDVPKLELPDGDWLTFYQTKMTAPQRMQTLVHLWNSANQEERVEFLRHLIDLINNPTISNRIKGGQEVLKDLDANFYRGVTFPEEWVVAFQTFAIDDKKMAFEKLFKSLDQQDLRR
ncbi:unnamed protein product [Symbiodinium microadriaticum]|nr:unnamed protein product [Symbiodinium microadriaticum]